jgi:DNA repair photolyase
VVVVQRRQRKGPVLTPSSLPCLEKMPTINVTEGCAHGCVYCYTQGYSGYPGVGRVTLLENIPELVEAELRRKRRKPGRVYFSPSSDAFQPVPEVLDVTFRTMGILLEHGVEVALLTKGYVPERFLRLFADARARVFAQVGITTLDEDIRKTMEPNAASATQRLETISGLVRSGAFVRARLDPLVPSLTDTAENLGPLLDELQRRGVRSIAASYLFLRPGFGQRLAHLPSLANATVWTWHRLADGVGGGKMIDADHRRERFARLASLAAEHGIDVHICACKNPDLPDATNCGIAGPSTEQAARPDAPLFGHLGQAK